MLFVGKITHKVVIVEPVGLQQKQFTWILDYGSMSKYLTV